MEIFLKTHPLPNLLKEAPQLKISDQFSIPKLIRYNRSLNFIDTYLQKAHSTAREIEIVQLSVKGKSAKEIAPELFFFHTVDIQRRNILAKLNCKNQELKVP